MFLFSFSKMSFVLCFVFIFIYCHYIESIMLFYASWSRAGVLIFNSISWSILLEKGGDCSWSTRVLVVTVRHYSQVRSKGPLSEFCLTSEQALPAKHTFLSKGWFLNEEVKISHYFLQRQWKKPCHASAPVVGGGEVKPENVSVNSTERRKFLMKLP